LLFEQTVQTLSGLRFLQGKMFGSTTIVMTDKTGTLTQASMLVTDILTTVHLIDGTKPTSHGSEEAQLLSDALMATEAIVENPTETPASWRYIGRPIETNIARAAQKAGLDVRTIITNRRVTLVPFNSTQKFSVAKDTRSGHVIMLGAPEVLLQHSTLSKDEYITIEAVIKKMSEEGKRLVGVARLEHAGKKKIDFSSVKHLKFVRSYVLMDLILILLM
jgi:Ca2+-transporting ATPase